jgi:hypothetical protein
MASPFAFGREDSDGSLMDPEEGPQVTAMVSRPPPVHTPRPPSGRPDKRQSRSDTLYSDDSDDSHRVSRRLSYLPSGVRRYVQKKEKKGSGHVIERMILCAIAVVLLWTTSLLVAKEIVVRVIPRPEVSAVRSKVERAADLTGQVQSGYKDCANEKVSQCDAKFEKDVNEENERNDKIRIANYVTLSRYG